MRLFLMGMEQSKIEYRAMGKKRSIQVSDAEIIALRARVAELEASERRGEMSLEISGLGLWEVDLPTMSCWHDEQCGRLLGYSSGEFTIKDFDSFCEILHPDDRSVVINSFEACASGASPLYQAEFRVRSKSGTWKWFRGSGKITERDAEGNPLRLLGTNSDIDQQKHNENELREKTWLLNKAQGMAKVGHWKLDAKTHEVEGSQNLFEIYEIGRDEANLPAFASVVHPDDLDFNMSHIQRGLDEGKSWDIEHRLLCRSGKVKYVRAAGEATLASDGSVLHIVGTVADITEEHLAAEDLRRARDRVRTTLDALPDLLFEMDRQGRICRVHAPSVDTAHIQSESLLGKLISEALPKRAADVLGSGIETTLNEGRASGLLYSLPSDQGEQWFEATMAKGDDDEEPLVVALVRNVTEQRRSEEEVRKHAKVQEVLIGEINHRVRNNLTAILGLLQIEDSRSRNASRKISDVLRELEERIRSIAVAHDLLSANHWNALPVSQICEQVIQATVMGHHQIAGRVEVEVASSPILISAKDAHHLALVVAELASNSLRHAWTDESLTISIEIAQDAQGFVLQFRDQGPGFPETILAEPRSEELMGLVVLEGIVCHSLRGEIALSNESGAVVTIRLPVYKSGGSG